MEWRSYYRHSIAAADIDSVGYSKEYAYAATLADRFEFGKASLYAALQYRDTETESASSAKVSKDSLNPTFAIAYKPVENLSVYASYAQSYTKPVEVSKSYDNAGEIFKPIKTNKLRSASNTAAAKFYTVWPSSN